MMEYVAIATVRNEEKYIERTMKSLYNQTIKPMICIVIDDYSTDETPLIISKYPVILIRKISKRYPIASYNMQSSLMYAINLMNTMYKDWKYLLKFDGDIDLIEKDYVEILINYLEDHKDIGIISGNLKGKKVWRGRAVDCAKIYRRQCWDDINGLSWIIHFDTHAILKAYFKGWKVHCLREKECVELRTSDRESLYEWFLTGATRYYHGNPLYHTILIGLVYLRKKPYFIGSIVMIINQLIMIIRKIKRPFTKEFYDYVNKYLLADSKLRLRIMLSKIKVIKNV